MIFKGQGARASLLAATMLVCVAPAFASAGETADEGLETIIVTASRREQSLSDTPQAISVISSSIMDGLKASGVQDIAGYTPGVDLQYFGPGRSRVTVRGISPDEQTGSGTVSYYIDEIAITASSQVAQPDVYLYDTQRVEFLRGPQGTLYGEGAMGGTIRVITNAPDLNEFGGSARVSGFTVKDGDNGYTGDIALNVPLIKDMLAIRVAAGYREEPGWIDTTLTQLQLFTPPPARYVPVDEIKDANSSDTKNLRVRTLFKPTDALTIEGTYIRNESDARTTNIATAGDRHTDFMLRPSRDKSDLFGLTVSYDFGPFQIVSASSWTKRAYSRLDPNEPFLTVLDPTDPTVINNYVDRYWTDQTAKGNAFTQEVRVVSSAERALRWTVGGYYRNSSGSEQVNLNYLATALDAQSTYTYDYFSDAKSFAIFGEAEYDFTDTLTLALGGRWFSEKETGPTHFDGTLLEVLRRDAEDFTPRITLSYKPTSLITAYATYSTGYRSGGFNRFGSSLGESATYKPDTTNNYEIGFRYENDARTFSLNANAFYIDWSDLQFVQLDMPTGLTYVGNANKASSKGVELEFAYRPLSRLQLSGNVTLTDAQTESDIHGNMTGIIPSGTGLPAVPKYRFSLFADYRAPLNDTLDWSLSAGVNGSGATESKLERRGTFVSGFGDSYVIGSRLGSYVIGNVSAGVSSDNWTASLFVRNIWNERAELGNDNFFPVFGQPIYRNPPRTIGIELSTQF